MGGISIPAAAISTAVIAAQKAVKTVISSPTKTIITTRTPSTVKTATQVYTETVGEWKAAEKPIVVSTAKPLELGSFLGLPSLDTVKDVLGGLFDAAKLAVTDPKKSLDLAPLRPADYLGIAGLAVAAPVILGTTLAGAGGAAAAGAGAATVGGGAAAAAGAGAATVGGGAAATGLIVGGSTTAAVLGTQAIKTAGTVGIGAMALDALKNPMVVIAVGGIAAILLLRKK
jgi:hypothetical protein